MSGKIVVLGSFVVDLCSAANSFPIPGQTVLGTSFKAGPGGKGSNQAVAAHRAGADLMLITKIGNDSFGKIATDFYQQESMSLKGILTDPVQSTGAALIMVDSTTGQNMITVVPGACAHFTAEDMEICKPYIKAAEFLLLQFEINMDANEKAIRTAADNNTRIILNPAPAASISDQLLSLIDTVTPNETEAWALTGVQIRKQEDMIRAAEQLHRRGVKNVVITLGDNGVFVSDGSRNEYYCQIPVRAVDTTGAGDSFNGCFVKALADGMDIFEAAKYGNCGGALSVTKPGTAPAMPYKEEIDQLYKRVYPNT